MKNNYLIPLKDYLLENSNTENALQMERYMKNLFEFYGVPSSIRGSFFNHYIANHGMPELLKLNEIIAELWKKPQREYQYFGMELLKKLHKNINEESIDLYEFMIVKKSWWDTVDFIAATLVGTYFKKYPSNINKKTSEWLASDNIWLQRTVLLFQLKYGEKTDTRLLIRAITELSPSKEFFIRKAIGWALRQYSKFNPDFVLQFTETYKNKLSGLSYQEALKVINKKKG